MKQTGILMSISSLPSSYGIGDFGPTAYQFIDKMIDSKVDIWQILPFNRLGYGNSPYQSYSSIAGDEIFISIDNLVEDGLLMLKEIKYFNEDCGTIDYNNVRIHKDAILKVAYTNFKKQFSSYEEEYNLFINSNSWLYDYCVFVTLKKVNQLKCWTEWPEEHRNWINDRKLDLNIYEDEINYQMFLQYIFNKQWVTLKRYANTNGIKIMGDIPYYVGIDSIDCWANQKYFMLNKDGKPTHIAGVPPDYFSETGQRWGNPIYNWEELKENNFDFWVNRLALNTALFDIIRIDHFRAFDTYWVIPAECPTAIEGQWVEAPGYEFFDTLLKSIPDINLVAEDLGEMRPEVFKLRDKYNFAGMKIIQFTFDPRETNNDFDDRENMIIYTGTHDNQTILGWYLDQDDDTKKLTDDKLEELGYYGYIENKMIEFCLDSIANFAVIPVQDIMGLDDSARMNIPGTIGSPNWEWKLKDFDLFDEKISIFKQIVDRRRNS